MPGGREHAIDVGPTTTVAARAVAGRRIAGGDARGFHPSPAPKFRKALVMAVWRARCTSSALESNPNPEKSKNVELNEQGLFAGQPRCRSRAEGLRWQREDAVPASDVRNVARQGKR